MLKPIIQEAFADNGEHSHWELINSENGELIWSEDAFDPEEYKCTAGVCPCLDDPCCETCTLKEPKEKVNKIVEEAKKSLNNVKIHPIIYPITCQILISILESNPPTVLTKEGRESIGLVNVPISEYCVTFKTKKDWEVISVVKYK